MSESRWYAGKEGGRVRAPDEAVDVPENGFQILVAAIDVVTETVKDITK